MGNELFISEEQIEWLGEQVRSVFGQDIPWRIMRKSIKVGLHILYNELDGNIKSHKLRKILREENIYLHNIISIYFEKCY